MNSATSVPPRAPHADGKPRRVGRRGQVGVACTIAVATMFGCVPDAVAAPAPVSVPCSAAELHNAITAAADGATITLAAGCPYELTTPLPTISRHLAIDSKGGSTLMRATTAPGFTIMSVAAGATVQVRDVVFKDGGGEGVTRGGAIDNQGGHLTVKAVAFVNNSSSGNGGAISTQDGTVTITHSHFLHNSAKNDGGAIDNTRTATARHDAGTLVVSSSAFESNQAGGNGGGISDLDGELILTGEIHFINNSAAGRGGGYFVGGPSGRQVNLGSSLAFRGNEPDRCDAPHALGASCPASLHNL